MISVSRKENETSSALVRRFTMRVQASGVLKEAKIKKFYRKPINKNIRRIAKLEREDRKRQILKLRKLGRLK